MKDNIKRIVVPYIGTWIETKKNPYRLLFL